MTGRSAAVSRACLAAFKALRSTAALCLVVGGLGAAFPARAAETETYPNRAIRIVVPAAPGPGDVVARLVGAKLADAVGVSVTIENRPGASYNIASEVVAKSPADGYTLLYAGSVIALLPSTLGKVAVDPVTSFAPITKLVVLPLLIVAHPSLGVRSLDEVLALARQRPGQIAYATAGIGTVQHLAASAIAQRAGVELLHVPYVNTGQALKDVLNGEVPLYFTFQVTVGAHLKTGQLQALAVASSRRMPALPDVPTVVELGFPEAAVDPWNGMLAPAGTPPAVIDRLQREFTKIMQQADVRERIAQMGMEPVGSTSEQFATDIRESVARWPAIVKAAGLRRE